MNKHLIALGIGAVIILGLFYFQSDRGLSIGTASGAHIERKCNVSNVTATTVGASNSVTILSASSQRAWAMLQLPFDGAGVSTSTVALSFDEGAASTLNDGIRLSTTTPSIVFGKKTSFPYTGAVTGITNIASTTVLLTECIY